MEAPKTTADSERCIGKKKEIENAQERLQLAVKHKDREKEASACRDLAYLYLDFSEDYKQSIQYGRELLRISQELGSKEQEAEACDILEKSYNKGKKDPESKTLSKDMAYGILEEGCAKESKRIRKELEELEAKACDVQAKSHVEVGDSEQSKESSKESPGIDKEKGDKNLEAEACGCSGELIAENFRK